MDMDMGSVFQYSKGQHREEEGKDIWLDDIIAGSRLGLQSTALTSW